LDLLCFLPLQPPGFCRLFVDDLISPFNILLLLCRALNVLLLCFLLPQPQYLESAGFAARGLLTSAPPNADSAAAAVANLTAEDDASSTTGSSSNGAAAAAAPGVLEQLQAKVNEGIAKIGEGVESVGNAVVKLGRWMRSQLTGEEYVADDDEACRKRGGPGSKAAGVMGAVMVVMVAIVAVALLRRPGPAKHALFKRLFRRA
jgi:hypothetical protein